MKILANDGISQSGKVRLEKAGFEVSAVTVPQEELIKAINDNNYDVLLVRSATKARKDLIDACPNLKLIGRGGVGLDNIDVEYAKSKGVEVINTPAASSQSVAEMVFAHLFGMVRGLYDANRQMPINGEKEFKSLKKKYGKGNELRGKTLGLIGLGRIGQFTAKYALGCGMKVIAFDPFVSNATIDIEIAGADTVHVTLNTISLSEVLKNSDFISMHIPMPADKKALITKNEFSLMKDGVGIVNAARGGVIDEDDLLDALNTGKVAYASLDVFVNEPTPRTDLLKHPKISLTPHVGAATVEAQDRIGTELADKIVAFFSKVTVH